MRNTAVSSAHESVPDICASAFFRVPLTTAAMAGVHTACTGGMLASKKYHAVSVVGFVVIPPSATMDGVLKASVRYPVCLYVSLCLSLSLCSCLPPPLLTHQCCRPPAAKLTLIYAWSLTGWQPRDGPARHKRRCYCVATVRVWPPYHRLCTILPATTAMPLTPPYAPMHLCTYPPGTAS